MCGVGNDSTGEGGKKEKVETEEVIFSSKLLCVEKQYHITNSVR